MDRIVCYLADGSFIQVQHLALVSPPSRSYVLVHRKPNGSSERASDSFTDETDALALADTYCQARGYRRAAEA